jgi:hypothetical protein
MKFKMITEWKKRDLTSFVGSWRGMNLVLYQDSNNNRWYLKADGLLVSRNWPNPQKAMNEIDQRQQNILLQASKDWQAKHPIPATSKAGASGNATA